MSTHPFCANCLCNEDSSGCGVKAWERTATKDPENLGGLIVLPRRCAEYRGNIW